MQHFKTIAIDFDGTIVENIYPKMGKPKLFAFEILQKLKDSGYRLILWTCRSGKELEEAVEFCRNKGLEFYAVNSSYDGEDIDMNKSRKIIADIFIDDRNIGGFPGWGEVYATLTGKPVYSISDKKITKKKKKTKRRFGIF